MNKWLKNHIPTAKSIENAPALEELKPYLENPSLWKFNCKSTARGVAVGLFSAMIPFPQMIIAALLAITVKGNLPLALLLTWLSNPLTFVPITYATYFIGKLILNDSKHPIVFQQIYWNFSSFHAFWADFCTWIVQFGKAYFVGLPILSIGLAATGYGLTILIWKGSVLLRRR